MSIPKTLDELADQLGDSELVCVLSSADARAAWLRAVRILCHPDRYATDPAQADRAATFWRLAEALVAQAEAPPLVLKSPKRVYTLGDRIAVGDAADVYEAAGDGNRYIVKIARGLGANAALEAEHKALVQLAKAAGTTTYACYYPTPCESFTVGGSPRRLVNVFTQEEGYFTLDQVHARHPALDGRTLVWIGKRLFTALGFAHQCSLVHGAVLPCHFRVHAGHHGGQLLGWGQSVSTGATLTRCVAAYRDWYPAEAQARQAARGATDIAMAARCLVFLAGGDPVTGAVPDDVPEFIRNHLKACLLTSPTMRPGNAFALHDRFNEAARGLYGAPKFHPLDMA
jgi:hypothetical protein